MSLRKCPLLAVLLFANLWLAHGYCQDKGGTHPDESWKPATAAFSTVEGVEVGRDAAIGWLRTVDVHLSQRIEDQELRKIASHVRVKYGGQRDFLNVVFHLPGMADAAWATAVYEEDAAEWTVTFLGSTVREEKHVPKLASKHRAGYDYLGQWKATEATKPTFYRLYHRQFALFLETRTLEGTSLEKITPVWAGTQLRLVRDDQLEEYQQGKLRAEYFIISEEQDLVACWLAADDLEAFTPYTKNGKPGSADHASLSEADFADQRYLLRRTWHDRSGEHSVPARLVSLQSGTVRLAKDDGSEIAVPIAKLSESDRAWVKNHTKP